jgi:hypothetical protein
MARAHAVHPDEERMSRHARRRELLPCAPAPRTLRRAIDHFLRYSQMLWMTWRENAQTATFSSIVSLVSLLMTLMRARPSSSKPVDRSVE